MIRILIAEDSKTVALLLTSIFGAEPDMEVVGHASTGREAVTMANALKPSIVTMDIRMPDMDGFEATRMIMSTNPLPIVVISSSVNDIELKTTFRAIEEGALAVIEKPRGITHPEFEKIRVELVNTVRAMADVKVIRRYQARAQMKPVDIFETAIPQKTHAYQVVAIGCSTGGPQALQLILSNIPVGFPIPIVVAQHISRGFLGGLVEWLAGSTLLKVKIAQDGEGLNPGTVYFAPDDYHLLVRRGNGGLAAQLVQTPPVGGFRPSATPLLESVARVCGRTGVGALLTGMGADGAAGLLALREAYGHTFVQDAESVIVNGMPGSAIALGAAVSVVRLADTASYLHHLAVQ